MTYRLLAAVAALAGAAACSDSLMLGTTTVNVSAVAPAPNAVNVARGDTIRMWLDMPVDSTSCAMRFTLHVGDSTGPAVPGRMLFGDGYRQMMFVPDSMMRPGTRYFAHMRDSVMMRRAMHDDGMGGQMMGGSWMMMTGQMPQGAVRMGDGMGWAFTTGS
jgi:hypothetical protein